MPTDTRTTTTLNIKVNGRELHRLDQDLKKIFNSRLPREFNIEIRQMNVELTRTARTAQRVAEALQRVTRGVDAYRRLTRELRDANREAERLATTLNRMSGGGPAGFGRGGGGGGGRAGGGGWRMPNAQLPMPGIGAISTALQAIPGAGSIAAGSLQAAAGTYSSRLRFEQARLQAAPYLIRSSLAAGSIARTRRVAAPMGGAGPAGRAGLKEAEVGAATEEIFRHRARGKLPAGVASALRNPTVMGAQEVLGMGAIIRQVGEESILAERKKIIAREGRSGFQGSLAEAIGTPEQAWAAKYEREKRQSREGPAARWARAGLGREGPLMAGGTGPAGEILPIQAASARGKAQMRTIALSPIQQEAEMRKAALRMGYAPAEMMQQAGQLASAANRPVGARELEGGLAFQRRYGVDIGLTGQTMEGVSRVGGDGSIQDVANLIGSAVASGLEGSEISEYLQATAGFLEQMSERGIIMDVEKLRATEAALSRPVSEGGAGLRSWRTPQIAQAFGSGGAERGYSGPQSAVDLRLMEAMGFTGKGGIEEYASARLSMQDPTQVMEAMPEFLRRFQVEGAGPEFQALITQQALSQFGSRVGPQEARKLSAAVQKGFTIGPGGEQQFDVERVVSAAQEIVGSAAPSVRAEAGIEADRVRIGAEVANNMQELARTTNNMAITFEHVLGDALNVVTGQMENFTAALAAATESMPLFFDITGVRTKQ